MNAPVIMKSWPTALATYLAAKRAEDVYDRDAYMPAFRRYEAAVNEHGQDAVPTGSRIPERVEAEIDRLQRLRHDAEDAIMAIPSPDASAFARKFLIARGEGRGADGWDDLLEAEAKGFAEGAPTPNANVTAIISPSFGELLGRYRDEMAALDAATEQGDIDWLADASFATLQELSATPVRGAWELAEKLELVAQRFADFDPPNMRFVKDALEDARRLSSDADFAFSWVQLWHAYGGFLTQGGHGRWYGKSARGTEAPAVGWSSMPAEPHLVLRNYDEWWGAMKAMETLFEMSSARARDAIFALAPTVKQEG